MVIDVEYWVLHDVVWLFGFLCFLLGLGFHFRRLQVPTCSLIKLATYFGEEFVVHLRVHNFFYSDRFEARRWELPVVHFGLDFVYLKVCGVNESGVISLFVEVELNSDYFQIELWNIFFVVMKNGFRQWIQSWKRICFHVCAAFLFFWHRSPIRRVEVPIGLVVHFDRLLLGVNPMQCGRYKRRSVHKWCTALMFPVPIRLRGTFYIWHRTVFFSQNRRWGAEPNEIAFPVPVCLEKSVTDFIVTSLAVKLEREVGFW